MSFVSWINRRVAPIITAVGITRRSVTLEVRGSSSAKPIRLSVSPSELNGKKYLVSLAGERAAILLAYVQRRAFTRSPEGAARLYFGLEAPTLQDTERLAASFPVFAIEEPAA